MRKTAILVFFFMNTAVAYAQTVSNTSSVTVNTTNSGITRKVTYVSGFKDDYSKPPSQNNQNDTANVTTQDAANITSQYANQTTAQSSDTFSGPAKVLVSKENASSSARSH